jgi:hypothetical protein
MAQHVTIVLASGGAMHYHGEVMYDPEEGILVVDLLETEATAHFPVKEGFVVSWITSEMDDEEAHLRKEAAEEARRKFREENPDGGLDH